MTKKNKNQKELCESDHQLLKEVNHKAGALSAFVILFYGHMSSPIDIGAEDAVTTIEMSILIDIVNSPGITATALSKKWRKTKGAISQILKKLEKKNLLYRIKSETDSKIIFLHPTEKGHEINQLYYKRDLYSTPKIIDHLLETCTKEELKSFYKVVEHYSRLIVNQDVL